MLGAWRRRLDGLGCLEGIVLATDRRSDTQAQVVNLGKPPVFFGVAETIPRDCLAGLGTCF